MQSFRRFGTVKETPRELNSCLLKVPLPSQAPPEQILDPTDYPQDAPKTDSQPESVPTTEPDSEPSSEPTLPPELDPESPSKPV